MSHSRLPALPEEVLALSSDVLDEILQYRFIKTEHGRRYCYGIGCRGPLCKRAERHESRERYKALRARQGKTHTPSDLRRDDRDEELDHALAVVERHAKHIEIYVRLKDLYDELEQGLANGF